MKKSFFTALTGMYFVFLISCSPVKFYSDKDLTKSSGLKYYTSKPYLLVEREGNTNNVVKANVIYLPDLSEPMYLAVKDGLGSRKVDIKLTDGTINTLGIASDPKIAETIESLAALILKTSAAVTDLSALKGMPQVSAGNTITELFEVVITREGTTLRKVEIKS